MQYLRFQLMQRQNLNAIFHSIQTWDGAEKDAFNPKINKSLKDAINLARKFMIPDAYVKRILQYAQQGFTKIEFPT